MNTYSPTYSDDDDEMGDIVEAYAEQEAADRPTDTDNAHDEEPLAWCPGCGDRIPTEVIRERGVCSNCYGTSDDPWAAGRTDRPSATDDARAVREAAMDLYRALRRTNPDALAEVDEVEDWTYWENIVRAAQVALAAARPSTDQALAEAWAEGHRTGWEHCQDGNYGNDHWDDPTPNPYAAAARPSVTDNARAEAMRRYPSDIADRGLTYPTGAVREHSRAAFIAGAEWAAGRAETTTATTDIAEDAVLVIHQALQGRWMSVLRVLQEDDDYPAMLHHIAKALADAGLLATARTRPTRDDLARAIASGYEPDHPTPNRHDYRAADAVLALFNEKGD